MEYGIKVMGYGWEMDRVNKSWCGGEEARGWGGVGRKQRLHASLLPGVRRVSKSGAV